MIIICPDGKILINLDSTSGSSIIYSLPKEPSRKRTIQRSCWQCQLDRIPSITLTKELAELRLLLAEVSPEHDQSCPKGCIHVLPKAQWQRECPLDLLLQHLIPGQRTPTPHHPFHTPLFELLKRKHRVQVLNNAPAQGPGHMTQGKVGGGDSSHRGQLVWQVPLAQHCWGDGEMCVFLLCGRLDHA